MKQGGDTNTIEVVENVRKLISHLYDVPSNCGQSSLRSIDV